MAAIVTAITVRQETRGAQTRYRFRYTLDNGEVHERNAWVPSATDEAAERTARGAAMLVELAEAEFARTVI